MCQSEIHGGRIKLWTPVHEVESSALDQLKNIANLPWAWKHVAGNVVARIVSSQDGKPVVSCGAKVAIITEYETEVEE